MLISNCRLPRLRKFELKLFGRAVDSVIRIMDFLNITKLTSLSIFASSLMVDYYFDETPFRMLDLGPIRYLRLKLPAHLLPQLVARLDVPELETLYLHVYYGSHYLERIQPSIMRFDRLLKFHLIYQARADKHLLWLLKCFGNFDTCIEAEIKICPCEREINQVVFPNLKKLVVRALGDLVYVSMPVLKHLGIQSPDVWITEIPWIRLRDAHQLPVDTITCLELDLDMWLWSTDGPECGNPRFFQPFKEVTRLVITHKEASFLSYSWPYCWKYDIRGESFAGKGARVLFPNLTSLRVDFVKILDRSDGLEIFNEILGFILSRKKLGRPIRDLRLNNYPDFHGDLFETLALEVDNLEIYMHKMLIWPSQNQNNGERGKSWDL